MQAKGCGLENEGPRERQSHADRAESCIEPRGQESFAEPRDRAGMVRSHAP